MTRRLHLSKKESKIQYQDQSSKRALSIVLDDGHRPFIVCRDNALIIELTDMIELVLIIYYIRKNIFDGHCNALKAVDTDTV